MAQNETVLIVAPHPDDETLGCGGILGIKSQAGQTVHIAVLTDGSMLFAAEFGTGTTPSPQEVSALRKAETERAVSFLGGDIANIHYFDFLDGSLPQQFGPVSDRLASLLRMLQPSEVYAPDPYEEHPDHVAANAITQEALRKAGSDARFYAYFLSLKRGMHLADIPDPIMEVPLGEHYARKKEALTFFHLHHQIILPQQREPLIQDGFASYLDHMERFILRTGP